jgi:NodT family efflux transporter outer membrane factor (OMF) lipoprotein
MKSSVPRLNADERGKSNAMKVFETSQAISRMRLALLCGPLLLLGACAVGPDYRKPEMEVPGAWKEAADWKPAQPADTQPKGRWWEAFQDPILSGLVEQVEVSNQQLQAALARYNQARAQVEIARASLFPALGYSADASRAKRAASPAVSSYSASLDAHWEVDLWGRIRRTVEAAGATAEASAADLEAMKLSLQAQVATNYFLLRATDVGRELLDDSAKNFERSYVLTQNRYAAGVAARSEVVQAEAQLRSTQASAIDLRATRANLEHAIANLIGKPPSALTIEPIPFKAHMPEIPSGIPSTLLERRPDIAAAERRMASANARIGVAEAAYFPSLDLTASIGFASGSAAHLFTAPNQVWSLGAALAGTILDFGARAGAVSSAKGAYDESVANYRQTVLDAFGEVEDNLAALHWLGEEVKVQEQATRAARESVVLIENQYRAGIVSILNVIIVQNTQLNEERNMVTLVVRRLNASVGLIRALGGTW